MLNQQCQKVQNNCQIYLKIAETRMENIVFGKYDPIWARCIYFECISSILFSNLIVKNDENLLVFPTKQFSKHFHFQVLQLADDTGNVPSGSCQRKCTWSAPCNRCFTNSELTEKQTRKFTNWTCLVPFHKNPSIF